MLRSEQLSDERSFARQAPSEADKTQEKRQRIYEEPRVAQDAITTTRKLMTTNRSTRVNDAIVSFHNSKPCGGYPTFGVDFRIITIDRQGTNVCSHPQKKRKGICLPSFWKLNLEHGVSSFKFLLCEISVNPAHFASFCFIRVNPSIQWVPMFPRSSFMSNLDV